jgi:SAM-dependent methyltransferase
MNLDVQQQIDWLDWLQRWDAQQEGYVPEREARFTAMFDALAALLPASFVALDLACGPGSISQRLLARFPGARAIAVDIDPVMLAIGQGAIGTMDGRLRWIEADLASPGWLGELGETQWMRYSAPPRCTGCRRNRWPASTATSAACCAQAASSSTATIWTSVRLRRPWRA